MAMPVRQTCPYKESECDEMLDKEYKFYLSFENSLCRDYVTEKIYNALRRQVIPIVYGGANYELFLPPRSYINAEEFESVEQLAMYLKYLSTHPKEYLRYFWWREHYKLGYFSPFCELCAQLHSVTNQQKTQTYRNIEQWWLGDSCRLTPRIKI
ncbi:alpha-(1,3)-fucosyltransferase C-like [Teleopsis dalmanni]|uniref:alpha-(1,3)-fucosyltransferase C-like n=1 Tax=Teleopsis dalmanni TaxID=139649 RepID=UPI0018CF555E|nr:alpha-(1,3)-fucosyltransferase C-like [Teleopsis dalmanni]